MNLKANTKSARLESLIKGGARGIYWRCVAFYSPMNIKTNTSLKFLFISGVLFLAFYFFYSLVYKIWSVFAFVLLVLLGFIILTVTVQAFLRNNRVALCFGLMMIGVVTVN